MKMKVMTANKRAGKDRRCDQATRVGTWWRVAKNDSFVYKTNTEKRELVLNDKGKETNQVWRETFLAWPKQLGGWSDQFLRWGKL